MTLLAARAKAIKNMRSLDPHHCEHDLTHRFVAYASKHINSSLARQGLMLNLLY